MVKPLPRKNIIDDLSFHKKAAHMGGFFYEFQFTFFLHDFAKKTFYSTSFHTVAPKAVNFSTIRSYPRSRW